MKNIDSNAKIAIEQFKIEMSRELGLENSILNISHKDNSNEQITKNLIENEKISNKKQPQYWGCFFMTFFIFLEKSYSTILLKNKTQ